MYVISSILIIAVWHISISTCSPGSNNNSPDFQFKDDVLDVQVSSSILLQNDWNFDDIQKNHRKWAL